MSVILNSTRANPAKVGGAKLEGLPFLGWQPVADGFENVFKNVFDWFLLEVAPRRNLFSCFQEKNSPENEKEGCGTDLICVRNDPRDFLKRANHLKKWDAKSRG